MLKKVTTISILVISIVLVSLYVIGSTYSVIINVIDRDGESEIINEITIRDLLTDDNGDYNNIYYQTKNELDITPEEADILIESVSLNRLLERILNDIVGYKLHNKSRMTNKEIYNLIVEAVNNDDTISEELKNKVISKSNLYIDDITYYIYDIDINVLGDIT